MQTTLRLFAFGLVALLQSEARAHAGEVVGPELPVCCPAIEHEETSHSWPPQALWPCELLVLGKGTALDGDRTDYRLDVEKVLAGRWSEKTLEFTSLGFNAVGTRRVFGLVSLCASEAKPFGVAGHWPAHETAALEALARTRFAFHTLRVPCIFVGKEIAPLGKEHRLVEVVRHVAGVTRTPGEKLVVFNGEAANGGNEELRREPVLCFIERIGKKPDGKLLAGKESIAGPVHHLAWRQPAEREAEVRVQLARRPRMPVVEHTTERVSQCAREVFFDGTHAEAIELLGSSYEPARILGERRLWHEREQARPLIRDAIEKQLFRTTEQTPGEFRRLRKLIALLGAIEKQTEGSDLDRLFARHLEFLEKLPLRDEWLPGADGVDEEQRDDVPHGLTWLALQLGEDHVCAYFGSQLLRLRDRLRGGWRQEVQLALDVSRVEDRIEVAAALKRLQGVQPLRCKALPMGHGHPRACVFTPDGQHLATAGRGSVRIWKTADWSLTTEFPVGGWIKRLRFASEGRFLYVAGGLLDPVHARYDWRTGKRDRVYTLHKTSVCELELSDDGRRMLTADEHDRTYLLTDTDTGHVLKSWRIPDYFHRLTLAPDGNTLLLSQERSKEGDSPQWSVEALEGPPPAIKGLEDRDAWLFSPAGRYLISALAGEREGRGTARKATLRVHDATRGYEVVSSANRPDFGTWFTISADGKRLAVVDRAWDAGSWQCDRGVRIHVLILPELRPVCTCSLTLPHPIGIENVSLSPDGKLLAACDPFSDAPHLFDATTGRRLMPRQGHPDGIRQIGFTPDGKHLRTIGDDNTICLWDTESLRMRQRLTLSSEYPIESIHPSSDLLLCRDWTPRGDDNTSHLFDAGTGRRVSTLALPEGGRWQSGAWVWVGERKGAWVKTNTAWCFDHRSGRLLKQVALERELDKSVLPPFAASEDRRTLLRLMSDAEKATVQLQSLDLDSGKIRQLQRVLPLRSGGTCGFVPGGKYVFVANPHWFLLDRRNLEIVAQRRFEKTDLLHLTFTRDGSRYAVAAGVPGADALPDCLIRIHDTRSGRTVGAFPTRGRPQEIQFDPTGRRLVVRNEEGVLELWDLSSLPKPLLPRQ
jgi:WD40 repeat protein